MASQRITVRVSKQLSARLQDESRARGKTPSDLLRVALQAYLGRVRKSQSAYELAKEAGLIGLVRRAPKDLSTNRRHFKGFGR
jgi:metal-responsive CopG/Arc/MetJ family transcriptional regulator